MNVTAFRLKVCQHDSVPWCSHSQHLDLICALLHNSPQEGLASNSANRSANEKSHPHHCLQTWALHTQQAAFWAQGSTTRPTKTVWKWWPFPNFAWPQRQCLISLCYSESRWIIRKETRALLKNQLLLLRLDFPGQYISKFFPSIVRREKPHSSTLSVKSSSGKRTSKGNCCLLKAETHSQPTLYTVVIQGCPTVTSRASSSLLLVLVRVQIAKMGL